MRRQDREVLQPEQIDAIIESCDCLRLGLNAEDGAYIVPLNFAYVPGKPAKFYFHSAKEGRKVDMIGQGAKAGFELDGAHRLGEAETGCRHTFFYQSVIGTGMHLDYAHNLCTKGVQIPHLRGEKCFSGWQSHRIKRISVLFRSAGRNSARL